MCGNCLFLFVCTKVSWKLQHVHHQRVLLAFAHMHTRRPQLPSVCGTNKLFILLGKRRLGSVHNTGPVFQ